MLNIIGELNKYLIQNFCKTTFFNNSYLMIEN